MRSVKGIWLFKQEWTLYICGEPVKLTVGQFLLLEKLMGNPGQVYSRQTILAIFRPYDRGKKSSRQVDTGVKRLRKAITESTGYTGIITTHHGLGYSIDPKWYTKQKGAG
jgi:DNA-binding response OmpR family regulator